MEALRARAPKSPCGGCRSTTSPGSVTPSWRDRLRYWKYLLKGKRPWGGVPALAHLGHLAQRRLRQALAGHGIAAKMLSDPIPVYTDPAYVQALPAAAAAAQRADTILYNPTKGAQFTARLMAAYPQWKFRPLRGLDREQLAQAFLEAKLYMDFGHHPGKDRLPREAALHGCCVITARHGSAANPVDVPIPERYKLDVKDAALLCRFGEVAGDVQARSSRARAISDGHRQARSRASPPSGTGRSWRHSESRSCRHPRAARCRTAPAPSRFALQRDRLADEVRQSRPGAGFPRRGTARSPSARRPRGTRAG